MTLDPQIDPQAWGVAPGYHDVAGTWHRTSPATAAALLQAMGATEAGPPGTGDASPVLVVTDGEPVRAAGRWELTLEDGTGLTGTGQLPAGLPLGYHTLHRDGPGGEVRLVVSPRSCHRPAGLRTWGWSAQLYALRSRRSWGIGDLGDLHRFCRHAAAQGAGLCLVNPLHAVVPVSPQAASPYSPSSRCWRNPLYIDVEDVPGAGREELAGELARFAAAGRALNRHRRVDRDRVWSLKGAALEAIWAASQPVVDREFEAFCDRSGASLAGYATFCVLTEELGAPWTAWPAPFRSHDHPAVAALVARRADRVRFHQWLQWLLDRQLVRVGGQLGLLQDLAIGLDPEGADVWCWPEGFPAGVQVGAPPDEFNTRGQGWGLAPFNPWALRAAGFEPFIQTVRAGFRHAGGLRFDHVMGLFRLFWIPPGGGPAQGAYVRYPAKELLDILALESVRAQAYVVGEDLGTVEPSVREELARRGVLGYRVMWFEPGLPATYAEQSLAAVSTHDLPTVAGLWSGSDLRAQVDLGLDPDLAATGAVRRKLRRWAALADDAPPDEAVRGAYRLLADAPSTLRVASLDDALAVEERPNMPGTVDAWPNWSLALPEPLEEIEAHPGVAEIARILGEVSAD